MHEAFAALVAVAGATPVPTPSQQVDPDLVTPGPWGFAIIVFIALAVILLIWDMLRRIRRGRVRADLDEQLEAEEQARQAAARGGGESSGDAPGEARPDGDTGRDAPPAPR